MKFFEARISISVILSFHIQKVTVTHSSQRFILRTIKLYNTV